MTIKEKISTFIKATGIKRTDFYNITGISASNFKGKANNSELGGDKIVKILTSYPELSPDWLLLDQGEMLRSVQSTLADNNIDDMSLIAVEFRRQVSEYKEEVQLLNKEIGTLREEIGGLKAENRILKEELVKLKSVVPSPPQNPSPAIDEAAVRCVDVELSDRI